MDQEVPGNETMKHSGIIEHSWLEVMDPLDGVSMAFPKKNMEIFQPSGRSFIWEIYSSMPLQMDGWKTILSQRGPGRKNFSGELLNFWEIKWNYDSSPTLPDASFFTVQSYRELN